MTEEISNNLPVQSLGVISEERVRDVFNELSIHSEKAMEEFRSKNKKFEFASCSGFLDGVREFASLLLNDDEIRNAERL